ncbi:class I SAM-dependent methyltransferase [Saccharopolyspora indica]|uniref:class I SAM-dependent methyltransferase n=1 Tax=Saccharopolyspora indica TaxID=1229659 RepID=UPI0022EB20EE|nr:class I SAM-dependent methyltransferase [Saccharopolyspora indica]MDA3645733.1 class I SAM-dependent methyltransferase [Saccharopolyspora indica]
MYGSDAAEIYDLLHQSRGKDFEFESEVVAKLIDAHRPDASSVLDVACGTGAHLEFFNRWYAHVEGVDASEPMLDRARVKLPGVRFAPGDMRTFSADRRFDAITCLFCSIAYLPTCEDLGTALERFARHLTPGGVAVVEPWWFPEKFTPGHVAADVVEDGVRTVARVSHASRTDRGNGMDVHYVIAERGAGIRHFAESHTYTPFTREQYETAFANAGFAVEFVEGAQSGRGLFVGVLER